MKTKEKKITETVETTDKKMTRKQAISKAGFIALSAATTMILISGPKKAAADSAPAVPDSSSSGTWTKRTP